jgi:hypothetical protein
MVNVLLAAIIDSACRKGFDRGYVALYRLADPVAKAA